MKRYNGLFLLAVVFFVMSVTTVLAVIPSGVQPVEGDTSSAPADVAGTHEALAGNVTELSVFGFTNTQAWQGYYGNVTGTIQLADSDDHVMYNWSLADPEGEIYASENSSINWTGTACYVNATSTALFERRFNITQDDVDGIDETFNLQDHDEFFVNNIQISADTCMSARIYDSTQGGVDQHFEEVLLTAGSGELVFTSLLEESPVLGFDGADHDFEMLVIEDGHGTDTSTTTYYFYVELH